MSPDPVPAHAALREVAALGGFFALPEEASHPAPLAAGFAERAREVNHRYGTDEARVGVSLAHLGLAARLWSPVLACTVLHGIVPDLTGVEWAATDASIRLRDPHGRPAGDDLPSVADAVYEQVVTPLAAVEHTLDVKIAPRLLDGNIASALAGSAAVLLRARPGTRTALTRLTVQLLATGRLAGTGRLTGPGLTFRRRSCCLFYRAPGGGTCGDCCLVGR